MSDELTTQQIKKFRAELTELSRRHGIAIAGCGCCGSPWVEKINDPDGRYDLEDPTIGSTVMWVETD